MHFISLQLRMVSTCSGKPIGTPTHLSAVSPAPPLRLFQWWSDRQRPFLVLSMLSASSFYTFLTPGSQWYDILTLCQQAVGQTPPYFRSSNMQATCDGYFACQSISFSKGHLMFRLKRKKLYVRHKQSKAK